MEWNNVTVWSEALEVSVGNMIMRSLHYWIDTRPGLDFVRKEQSWWEEIKNVPTV